MSLWRANLPAEMITCASGVDGLQVELVSLWIRLEGEIGSVNDMQFGEFFMGI